MGLSNLTIQIRSPALWRRSSASFPTAHLSTLRAPPIKVKLNLKYKVGGLFQRIWRTISSCAARKSAPLGVGPFHRCNLREGDHFIVDKLGYI